jgi:hypothetical protein
MQEEAREERKKMAKKNKEVNRIEQDIFTI